MAVLRTITTKKPSELRPPINQGNKQLAASAPSLVSKLLNPPGTRELHNDLHSEESNSLVPHVSSVMYSELDAQLLETNVDKAHKSPPQDSPSAADVGYTPMSLHNSCPANSLTKFQMKTAG